MTLVINYPNLYTAAAKVQIKKLESIKYRLLTFKWSTIFNKFCLKAKIYEDILLRYRFNYRK